jgi:hypothetical protein
VGGRSGCGLLNSRSVMDGHKAVLMDCRDISTTATAELKKGWAVIIRPIESILRGKEHGKIASHTRSLLPLQWSISCLSRTSPKTQPQRTGLTSKCATHTPPPPMQSRCDSCLGVGPAVQ